MSLSSFDLGGLSRNEEGFTIEEFITSLQATTTLKDLNVRFDGFTVKSTPEINRLFIEPLCRCITNLRCHNQNHPLRTLHIIGANEDVCHVASRPISRCCETIRNPSLVISRNMSPNAVSRGVWP